MKRPLVIALLIVALVLVCAGIGSVIFFLTGGFPTNILEPNLVSASAEESKTVKIDAKTSVTLEITDDAGNVTVVGADVDSVQVKAVKTAYAPTQARAEEELKTIKYKIDQVGNSITITYDLPNIRTSPPNITVIDANRETVDFIVTVPVETKVTVNAGLGKINISGLQGQASIESNFGDITVEKVDGALDVNTNSGRIDVTSVAAGTGDVDIHSDFGTISLNQISGAKITVGSNSGKLDLTNVRATKAMELTTDFGDIDFETGSASSLNVKTQSGAITLTSINISGDLTVQDDFGDINVKQVKAASYDTETNSGTITVDGAKDKLRAHTGFGNINIKSAENATLDLFTQSGSIDFTGSLGEGPHTVRSDFGEIELTIPADSALSVELKTEFGTIKSDIPITMTLTGDIQKEKQSGTMNGGGASLNVDTNSGSITIRAASK